MPKKRTEKLKDDYLPAEVLEELNLLQVLWDETTCIKCGAKVVPALDCKNFHTGEWDGKSYKFPCDCGPKVVFSHLGVSK